MYIIKLYYNYSVIFYFIINTKTINVHRLSKFFFKLESNLDLK